MPVAMEVGKKAKLCFASFKDVITTVWDVITTVCEKVANSIRFVYGPCRTPRVDGRVCTRPCTRSCTRCTRIVNTVVYTDRAHGRIHV